MSDFNANILDSPVEYIKGVGPARAELFQKELKIFTLGDLLFNFPFRYVDRTKFHLIKDLHADSDLIQLKGELLSIEKIKGKNNRSRLTAILRDSTGFIELVWFQGVNWIEKILIPGEEYICFGRVSVYQGKKSIAHPEMELVKDSQAELAGSFDPVYSSTEKLEVRGLDNKSRRKLIKNIIHALKPGQLPETLPEYVTTKLHLCSRENAIRQIHFPASEKEKNDASVRIKFEEFFYLQVRLLQNKMYRKHKYRSMPFLKVGEYFNEFYQNKMSFELTGAQKRVIREIRNDLGRNTQMNRLLQGDVGSGKTIVALLSMLIALDNGFQSCMMAPTEILAKQHFISVTSMLEGMSVNTAFLSGSIKGKKRESILEGLKSGDVHIVIGTHALIEDPVEFSNIGLAIIDEQHRFGVAQRAALWKKSVHFVPHVLVMTATPIPRTLAMTFYGDLDVSVIDELPPGRKSIKTIHKYESARPNVIQFMHQQIGLGRQIYVVYPLIEESEKLDLKNLNDGYERLLQYFPPPDFQISVVHGRMKAADKEYEMQRFVTGITQIMVATTVIEVGVNVPNASVMIIENTERFGLSQLHQLRGRVGRGADQSYCILMTDHKISKDGRERIRTMVETNNGFEIAEADLKLRGPGDIQGTQQSGLLDFKLLNISQDKNIMDTARNVAVRIIENDPELSKAVNKPIADQLMWLRKKHKDWSRIS